MFDLDRSIREWRSSLPDGLRVHGERVEELEQHLRDAYERHLMPGVAPDAAWAKAVESLGAVGDIAREFVKLDGRRWVPAWIAWGAMAMVVVGAFVVMAGLTLRGKPLLAAHVLMITIAYCASIAVGFIAAAATLSRALFGWESHQHESLRMAGKRLALLALAGTVPGVVLGAIWAHQHMGRWWGWDPKEIGGLCVLAWSVILLKSFSSREIPEQFLMMLGLIGNAVVAVSWFGPVLLESSHRYGLGPSMVGALLSGFVILQMTLVYIALLPSRALRVDRLGGGAER